MIQASPSLTLSRRHGPSWLNFQEKKRDIWSRPMAVMQREAEAREKQPTETLLVYYFQKLNLLMKAFPESLEATHVSRIRARFNDAQADRYIRETQSLKSLANEIRQYDDHLKLHPVPTMVKNSYSTFTPRAGYVGRTTVPKPTTATPLTKPKLLLPASSKEATKEREKASEYAKRNLLRIRTIDDRVNPATGKKTRSFLRTDGLPKFIERLC